MSLPQYTYKDYILLKEMISKRWYFDNKYGISSYIIKYILAKIPQDMYDYNNLPTRIKECCLGCVPDQHEILSMVMPSPFKKYIYDIPLEDIPLEINSTYGWVELIAQWRLKIGK